VTPTGDINLDAADVNFDGEITVMDAYITMVYYATFAAGNTTTFEELSEKY